MDVASLLMLLLLLLALALAVQPWSVLAAVLLIASEGGVAKTVAYVAGWVLALSAVAVATIALYPETPKVASGSPWTSWVQIASGVALGGWLLLRSRGHVAATSAARPPEARPAEPQPTDPQQSQAHQYPAQQSKAQQWEAQSKAQPSGAGPLNAQPRWMARLDSMTPLPAFVLGAFLPNYAIVVAAVGNIIASGISRTWAVVALVLFIVVASAG
ncbi:MAG TPA: GAP family protein, partial [Dermatophilaceae bacterium]